ncbi:hypothetical protein D5R81_10695 [Parashewanella spongiae]|uniref:Uncharacterized protein n=1 Tax=Parashewanella spongiae TaxID=342950 RepID=A0A3A6TLF7_9GAMM|nr:hypothetical protein [Parashewanella spongiae]MCL1078446.1 hypothetical protein [Parashewanella spongiae]RJY14839.1 hypothetical protein D5R81_10695 [Parashewanella spongiae]
MGMLIQGGHRLKGAYELSPERVRHTQREDISEKEACSMGLWDKFKNWIRGTDKKLACKCLYRLHHKNSESSVEDAAIKIKAFRQLKALAGSLHEKDFYENVEPLEDNKTYECVLNITALESPIILRYSPGDEVQSIEDSLKKSIVNQLKEDQDFATNLNVLLNDSTQCLTPSIAAPLLAKCLTSQLSKSDVSSIKETVGKKIHKGTYYQYEIEGVLPPVRIYCKREELNNSFNRFKTVALQSVADSEKPLISRCIEHLASPEVTPVYIDAEFKLHALKTLYAYLPFELRSLIDVSITPLTTDECSYKLQFCIQGYTPIVAIEYGGKTDFKNEVKLFITQELNDEAGYFRGTKSIEEKLGSLTINAKGVISSSLSASVERSGAQFLDLQTKRELKKNPEHLKAFMALKMKRTSALRKELGVIYSTVSSGAMCGDLGWFLEGMESIKTIKNYCEQVRIPNYMRNLIIG